MESRLKYDFTADVPQVTVFHDEDSLHCLLESLNNLCASSGEDTLPLDALKTRPESDIEKFVHACLKSAAGKDLTMYPAKPGLRGSEKAKHKCPPASYCTFLGLNLNGNVDCAVELGGEQYNGESWPRFLPCEVKHPGLVELASDGKLVWPQDWFRQAVGQLDSCFNKERAYGHLIVSDGRTWVFFKGTREPPTAADEPPVRILPRTHMSTPSYVS